MALGSQAVEAKREIRNMVNYKCHIVLKGKAGQLFRRNKTFLHGPPMQWLTSSTTPSWLGARLVKAPVWEIQERWVKYYAVPGSDKT